MVSMTSDGVMREPSNFMASVGHIWVHCPQRVHALWSIAFSSSDSCITPSGHSSMQSPHPMQRDFTKITVGSLRHVWGLLHQRQRSGHPFMKTTVRMPGPSCIMYRFILATYPAGSFLCVSDFLLVRRGSVKVFPVSAAT